MGKRRSPNSPASGGRSKTPGGCKAANPLQRYQPDYRRSYQKKYREAHHRRRALILTARKAIRLIFALLHKGRLVCLEEGVLT